MEGEGGGCEYKQNQNHTQKNGSDRRRTAGDTPVANATDATSIAPKENNGLRVAVALPLSSSENTKNPLAATDASHQTVTQIFYNWISAAYRCERERKLTQSEATGCEPNVAVKMTIST